MSNPKKLDDVDWARWRPTQRATLCFVVRDGEVLLIRKKRGLGAGKINGPGGRLEADETPRECAIRETQEELCVTPTGVREAGLLRFQFVDGLALEGTVFTASNCIGDARETDEAIPQWTSLDALPFDEMWADDELWFPHMLAGRYFTGRFLFDDDRLLGHAVEVVAEP